LSGERIALQPAYVLHRRSYGETSLLVEAFTAEYGRVGLVAKGARRGRLQAILQPFQPVLLSWSGRGELRTLTGAEPQGAMPSLAGRTLFSGFYLNELLLKLLAREDPHPELFARYSESLAGLAADEEWSLRLFERDLLRGLGYGLSLDYDGAGELLEPEALYDYLPEQGPVRLGGGQSAGRWHDHAGAPYAPPLEGTQGNPSPITVHGRSLLALAGLAGIDELTRRETKRLLRAMLAIYLNGRVLESRALYRGAMGIEEQDEEK
jgi:DNA repair protein RecO (recombination protein O)